ncbi:bacitracin ABC transporter permease [Paenibacillus sp. IHB B 3084]|uniref:undecaprenyl-diphosphatase n=1 Tax=Paenibacillus sp. IHB B 3084 TaxID=867076 RepID=UPI0007215239|nr:undecaprenyl-diphosphatase [Paenibacillus sp. IHB B 3084]ALP38868.1 bacitracin ABC transporter permease [Paenibacillus sp. IHB B 3084]
MLIKLDYALFHWINGLAEHLAFLNGLMRFMAQYAPYLFGVALLIYWFTFKMPNRMMVLEAILTVCIGFVISWGLGHLFYRDRPFVGHSVIQLIHHDANVSFPSNHALGAFALASILWLHHQKYRVLWVILAVLISVSRVWTGVHYPSDILAGALIGAGCAVGIHTFIRSRKLPAIFIQAAIIFYENWEQKLGLKPAKQAKG